MAYYDAKLLGWGFRKRRPGYYQMGKNGLLCGIWPTYGLGGGTCTLSICYFLGDFPQPKTYPHFRDADFSIPIEALSHDTINGERFLWGGIDFGDWTPEELDPYFDAAYVQWIHPCLEDGVDWVKKNWITFQQNRQMTPWSGTWEEIFEKLPPSGR